MSPNGEQKKRNKHNPDRGHQGKTTANSPVNHSNPASPIPPLTVLTSEPELKAGKKWCFEDSTPIYFSPEEPLPSNRLSKGTIVGLTGQKLSVSAAEIKASWLEVAYKDFRAGNQWVTGWINEAYLDDCQEKSSDAGVAIQNPTPDPNDARQYIIWEGEARHNLCGEFCVAFILNDAIDSVLSKWKEQSPVTYNPILGGSRDETTSVNDLENMLGAILGGYGYDSADDQMIRLDETLTYPVNPTGLLENLQRMLTTHTLISGVMINTYSAGELVRKDSPVRTGHWVVLDRITRNGNRFEIYNPFLNRREEYSFTEFYNSFSTNSGLWVKRKETCPDPPVEDIPRLEVKIASPNPAYSAVQYINVEGKKKTKLCGEFCVAFILNEAIENVLKCWKEVQPILYATIVGANEGTGVAHLQTILRAYGYNTKDDFVEFSKGLTDPFLKKCLVSPGRITKMLKTHFLIAGVNIDGRTGRLKRGNDVPHWVVLTGLTPVEKNMGWVEIYNPFQNRWEEYSWREFTNAIVDGYWSGLWVKRSITPVYIPQVVVVANTEDQPWKDVRSRMWTERQLDDALRQMVRTGKPIKKIAENLADQSGWKANKIAEKLRSMKDGQIVNWPRERLSQEIRKQLQNGKPVKKISVNRLVELSGWKPRDVKDVLGKVSESEKWTDKELSAAIRAKLKTSKSENKIAAGLFEKSGWKKREVVNLVRSLKASDKWTVEQLRRELENHLENGKLKDKALTKLVANCGWKRSEIQQVLNNVMASRKWTGLQLLDMIRSRVKTARSADKVVAELMKQSGWNRQEIRKLIEAQKWPEEHLRQEIEHQLDLGRSANKIAMELSIISGWNKSSISRMLKAIKAIIKVTEVEKRKIIEKERIVIIDPQTIIHASKPLAEFVKWQDNLLSVPGSRLYRVRKWGDPAMTDYDFDVTRVNTSNFQAVGLYNDGNQEFGAITNFIRISHEEVLGLRAMQIEDNYEQKVEHWRMQKMNWLCKPRGTIYFFDNESDQWHSAPRIRWGTLALGGNLVQVLGTATLRAKMRDGTTGPVKMARLKGFTAADWGRPLDDLLTEGLVHRCFCAYKGNDFGDSPKGIVYSPFFSPKGRDFAGRAEARSLYIPFKWLETKNP